jgi:hypothetical protein
VVAYSPGPARAARQPCRHAARRKPLHLDCTFLRPGDALETPQSHPDAPYRSPKVGAPVKLTAGLRMDRHSCVGRCLRKVFPLLVPLLEPDSVGAIALATSGPQPPGATL